MIKDNVLTEIAWIKTNKGDKTVDYVLKNAKNLQLDTSVKGFEYGAQLRFLVSIFPLIVQKADGKYQNINDEIIDEVISDLTPYSCLLDEENPFLQLPKHLAKHPEKLEYGVNQVSKEIPKIYPSGFSERLGFWNFEKTISISNISLSDATLVLVSGHFYRAGGNSSLDGGTETAPKNAAPGLKYTDSTPPALELIPLGNNLLDTLLMVTPKRYLEKENVSPYWADRNFKKTTAEVSSLWIDTWSSNVFFCIWDTEDEENILLKSVGIGLAPKQWRPSTLFNNSNKEMTFTSVKEIHDLRVVDDPFYFYYDIENKGKKETKLFYGNIGSEPTHYVARWNASNLSKKLSEKWQKNLKYHEENLENIMFLEHASGGTSQSFEIRYSRITIGWKNEFLPDESIEDIDEIYGSVLRVKGILAGMFTDNGTMKHLKSRKNAIEAEFWANTAELVDGITNKAIKKSEVQKVAKKIALKTLDTFSSRRNTVNIEAHLKAQNIIMRIK